PLRRRSDGDPVEVVARLRERDSTEGAVAEKLATALREQELVAALGALHETQLEELERHGALLAVEHARGGHEPPQRGNIARAGAAAVDDARCAAHGTLAGRATARLRASARSQPIASR